MGDGLDIQNGGLSFANPNYHLDPADVNSNPEPTIETVGSSSDDEDNRYNELLDELDSVCHFNRNSTNKGRRSYARLSIGSMGVDLDCGVTQPLLTADSENNVKSTSPTNSEKGSPSNTRKKSQNTEANNNSSIDDSSNTTASSTATMGRRTNGFLEYYMSLEAATRQRKESPPLIHPIPNEKRKQRSQPESPNSESSAPLLEHNGSDDSTEVPHIQGSITNDLYAIPIKRKQQNSPDLKTEKSKTPSPQPDSQSLQSSGSHHHLTHLEEKGEDLPPGWEKHEDEDGPYFWHIVSGTIQREPPPTPLTVPKSQSRRASQDLDSVSSITSMSIPSSKSSTSSSTRLSSDYEVSNSHRKTENLVKRRSYPQSKCSVTSDKKPIRFAVRSLGWVEIEEEDLTPERSSKAVNKCIVDLSLGRNDILDVVGRWGDGKDLYMDLDDSSLRLTDPQDLTLLNTQPIHTIRVWGVGRDNGRDFAYVARDRITRKHMCHVFRCDIPARIIANTLRDICKKIMIERSLHQNLAKPLVVGSGHGRDSNGNGGKTNLARPTNLPTEQKCFLNASSQRSYNASQSFPTPMEEPKKVLKVHYLGTLPVSKPVGVEILNAAIDRLVAVVPPEQYKFVNVAVAPSTITVTEPGAEAKQLAECRVRFLSFLGIGRSVKHCGFIMHTAQDQFVAHVFYCEPSSGALCKTVEAACKLRYQKCLDAHREALAAKNAEAQHSKGLSSTIRSVLGNLTTRVIGSAES